MLGRSPGTDYPDRVSFLCVGDNQNPASLRHAYDNVALFLSGMIRIEKFR